MILLRAGVGAGSGCVVVCSWQLRHQGFEGLCLSLGGFFVSLVLVGFGSCFALDGVASVCNCFWRLWVDSQKHIDFSLTSPFGGGRPGRVKRRNQKAAIKKASGEDGDDEE
ncbi:hypothetical protein Dsin_023736 [Dipteronia sinensis]|uniref:Uncharacterized protein n=1 Tax=Dipteronia sinensis TaxID=43782 RepID=A0AAE0E164_9ROSI|nr:hypothetical protein Dsin_023736 [Dipteronia sinensis]